METLGISDVSEAIPAERVPAWKSAWLKVLVGAAVVLGLPTLFAATVWAQGCSCG
jgi:uncharacterized membrane protein YphA (DoxX/SURF4 family)